MSTTLRREIDSLTETERRVLLAALDGYADGEVSVAESRTIRGLREKVHAARPTYKVRVMLSEVDARALEKGLGAWELRQHIPPRSIVRLAAALRAGLGRARHPRSRRT